MITSPSGKMYIGQTINYKRRMNCYKTDRSQGQTIINRSIEKYGWDAHQKKIIHICQPEELDDLERYYIELYQTFESKFGMNLRTGGNGNFKVSLETRKKLSQSHKGQIAWSKGLKGVFKHSEEWKQKARERMLGKKLFLGGTQTKETRDKISSRMKGRVFSEEHKRKLSDSKKGNKNGMFGKVYSEEEKTQMSQRVSGEKSPFYGKKRSEEVVANIKEGIRLSKLKKQQNINN